jgi:hypothetical protein
VHLQFASQEGDTKFLGLRAAAGLGVRYWGERWCPR